MPLKKHLKSHKLSALLITKPENILYLTSFSGTFAYVLVTPKKTYLFTDGRYIEKAKKLESSQLRVMDISKFKDTLKKYKTIGFEMEHTTVGGLNRLKKQFSDISWKACDSIVENIRLVKTDEEIRTMKKAAKIGDAIFLKLKKCIRIGITETELSWKMEQMAKEMGATGMSFDSIVAFGSNSAIPHHQISNRKLKKGNIVLLDFGVKYKSYCSDMTRVLFTAKPTAKQQKIYELVLAAQERGVRAVKSGVKCSDIDNVCRSYIADAGFEEEFCHSSGHGVGLEIHEKPTLSSKSKEKLRAGIVVTVEPGVYLPGSFGVRIEDMVLVTEKGRKVLTKTPKVMTSLELTA